MGLPFTSMLVRGASNVSCIISSDTDSWCCHRKQSVEMLIHFLSSLYDYVHAEQWVPNVFLLYLSSWNNSWIYSCHLSSLPLVSVIIFSFPFNSMFPVFYPHKRLSPLRLFMIIALFYFFKCFLIKFLFCCYYFFFPFLLIWCCMNFYLNLSGFFLFPYFPKCRWLSNRFYGLIVIFSVVFHFTSTSSSVYSPF